MTPATRPRARRRLRLLPIVGYAVLAVLFAWFIQQRPTTTVMFVRHADIDELATEADPSLNTLGRERAQQLADFLVDVDVVAGVDAIFTSGSHRTEETAAPLAMRLGLTPERSDPYNVEHFIRRLLRRHRGEIVLVVTNADAMAPLIDELHGSKRLPKFGPNDYGELYIVTIPWYGKVKTLRLHYGALPSVVEVSDSQQESAAVVAPQ